MTTLGRFKSKWWFASKEVFCRKGVFRNFAKFTGKHLCQSPRPATLLKKRLWHNCSPVNFAIFLRTPFFTEDLWTTASAKTVKTDYWLTNKNIFTNLPETNRIWQVKNLSIWNKKIIMPTTIASFDKRSGKSVDKWSGESDTPVVSGSELQIRSVPVHSNCIFVGTCEINVFMRLAVTVM